MKLKLRALVPARKQRGQSLVELAISLTVMLLLLAGAVTFGMALFSYVAIRDAAQEGALYGSFNPYVDQNGDGKYTTGEPLNVGTASPPTGICGRVVSASQSPVNMTGFDCQLSTDGQPVNSLTTNTIRISATTGNPCEGITGGTPNGVQVRVEYNYPVFMPFVGAIVGNQIHLDAVVTDTILEPRCGP